MKTLGQRLASPRNRLARFYDNGGESADRFTLVYLRPNGSRDGSRKWYEYRAASEFPFHPQGVGLYYESGRWPLDAGKVARMGRRNFLGRRVPFSRLPADVQRLAVQDLTPETPQP